MGGGNSRKLKIIHPKRQINAVSSVRRVEASSHRVSRYGAPGPVAMNEDDPNADM